MVLPKPDRRRMTDIEKLCNTGQPETPKKSKHCSSVKRAAFSCTVCLFGSPTYQNSSVVLRWSGLTWHG